MKAMILAAGRGERMRPLTDTIPKPLLEVNGLSLIEHQLLALKKSGINEFIINIAIMGNQIQQKLNDGTDYGVTIHYSDEGDSPLETAGGIIQALDFFQEPFLVTNADIYTHFDYKTLPTSLSGLAHLVLVDNPPHHPQGDFVLNDGQVLSSGEPKLTFSGISIYHPAFFESLAKGERPLAPLLFAAADKNVVSGQHFKGYWNDVGTPARLQKVNADKA